MVHRLEELSQILTSLVSSIHDYDHFIADLPMKFEYDGLNHTIELDEMSSVDYIIVKKSGSIIVGVIPEEQFKELFLYYNN